MTSSSVFDISAKSRNASTPTAVDITVWCAAPAVSQAAALVWKSGAGRHTAWPTGSFGIGSGQRLVPPHVRPQPDPVPHVTHRDHPRRTRVRGEDQPHRIRLPADAQRMH